MSLNMVIRKFEGDKPDIDDYVVATDNGAVRKYALNDDNSTIIGIRAPTAKRAYIPDDELLIQLVGPIDTDFGLQDNPLFTARVDQQGRISILKRFRDKAGIQTGDLVDVFDMKKVE